MKMNGSNRLKSAILLLMLFAVYGWAQGYRARVEGIVTDESKAVVAGATVTLLNVNTGIKVVRQTSDTGLYLFDCVDPGTYSVTVEATGFSKFMQENIVVQTRGDVTVNATLKPGAVQESITVNETPAAVEFNSTNKDFTIDSKMAEEIPRFDRNPFKLTLIAPSAVNTRGEMQPYHSWSANSVDLGGGTNLKNDLQVDGMPDRHGPEEQLPAQHGRRAGSHRLHQQRGCGIRPQRGRRDHHDHQVRHQRIARHRFLPGPLSVAQRRSRPHTVQPELAAAAHVRRHAGQPDHEEQAFQFLLHRILESRLSEQLRQRPCRPPWKRSGDFSQSLNIDGGAADDLRSVDDAVEPADGRGDTSRRSPGNKIPQNRFDPLSASLIKQFWAPNNPGDNITGVNNYKKGFIEKYDYYNFSDRVDYNINDKWKVFGRVAGTTRPISPATRRPTTRSSMCPPAPREAPGISAAMPSGPSTRARLWSSTATGTDCIDAYVSTRWAPTDGRSIWPNNDWYKPYQTASVGVPVYFPDMNIGGNGFGGGGFYWNQKPKGEAFNVKIAQQRGSHYLKAGFEQRESYGLTYVSSTIEFLFQRGADRRNLQQSGHPALRRPVRHVPAGRAGRIVADDRRTRAGSARQVLRHVLPGRLETVNRRITLEPGPAQRVRNGALRSGAQLLAGAGPLAAGAGDAGQSAADAGGSHRHRRQQLL